MNEEPRFKDNGNKTVTDNQTGLTWASEDSWQTEATWVTWDEAVKYADDLCYKKFIGQQDWRLPNQEEALTLVSPEKTNKDKYGNELHLDPVFPEGSLPTLWCQDGVGSDGKMVDFRTGKGSTLYKSKSGRMAARPVRGTLKD